MEAQRSTPGRSKGQGRGERLAALLDSLLLVPTPDDPEVAGSWTLVERDVLSVLMDEDANGLVQPVFTSVAGLLAWRSGGGCYVERAAGWVFEVAAADPTGRIAIDLGSPAGLALGPNEIAALAAGTVPTAARDVQVLVATPVEPLPPDVAEAVREVLVAEPAVGSARLFLLDVGAERNLVVFVDLVSPDGTAPDVDAVMGRTVEAIAARTDAAAGLRFQVVTDEWRLTYETGGVPLAP